MNIGRAAVLITGSMIASYFILLAFWTVFHGRQTVLALFWTSQNKVDKSQLYYEKPICFLSCEQYDYILLTFFFFFGHNEHDRTTQFKSDRTTQSICMKHRNGKSGWDYFFYMRYYVFLYISSFSSFVWYSIMIHNLMIWNKPQNTIRSDVVVITVVLWSLRDWTHIQYLVLSAEKISMLAFEKAMAIKWDTD